MQRTSTITEAANTKSTATKTASAKPAAAKAAAAKTASPKTAATAKAAAAKPATAKASSNASSTASGKPKQTRIRIRPETRDQMIERLLNPEISLHEASVIIGVCRATVRRYADSDALVHERTEGNQRRFRLREVLNLSRTREAEKQKRKRRYGRAPKA